MSDEMKRPTQNDVAEVTELFRSALNVATSTPASEGLNTGSVEIMDLLDRLMDRVPSVENAVLPPIMTTFMKTSFGPILEVGHKIKDKYTEKIERALDRCRYKEIPDLLKLSVLNQSRLQYGGEPAFSHMRDCIVKKYNEDITDPEGSIGFVPSKSPQTEALWHIIQTLYDKGLVTILEDNCELSSDNSDIKVAIIRMAENV